MQMTIKGFIHAHPARSWDDDSGNVAHGQKLSFWEHDDMSASGMGHQMVCPATVTFDLPDNWDPRPGQIAALREKERQARADFQKTITDIQRQISQLQAIEMSPAEHEAEQQV